MAEEFFSKQKTIGRDFDDVDYMNANVNGFNSCHQQKKTIGKSLSSWGITWLAFSTFISAAGIVSFVFPYWLQGSIVDPKNLNQKNMSDTTFGVWRRCNYYEFNAQTNNLRVRYTCGRYLSFSDIPSFWWQIAALSMCIGCILNVFVTVYGIITCCIREILPKCLAQFLGVCQFTAGK